MFAVAVVPVIDVVLVSMMMPEMTPCAALRRIRPSQTGVPVVPAKPALIRFTKR